MQCKVCRNESKDSVKARNGYICRECYNAMPESIKKNIDKFTIRQIFRLRKIVSDKDECLEKILVASGNLAVGRDFISLNGKVYRLKDLKSIRLGFHPKSEGSFPGTAVGTATVILETKHPRFQIEEPFYPNDVIAGYKISGKTATYSFSYAIESLIVMLQNCIASKCGNMIPHIEDYKKSVQQKAERKKAEEERKKSIKEKEQQRKKRMEDEARKKAECKKESYKGKTLSPFDEAKVLFCVEMPYTKDQLKKIRNTLMRKYHPDEGGSDEMCKKITSAYEILAKFASD